MNCFVATKFIMCIRQFCSRFSGTWFSFMQQNALSANGDNALLLTARRMAQRSRAPAACLRCKAKKVRCSDYRPCARCSKATPPCMCKDALRLSPSAIADEIRKKQFDASLMPSRIQSPNVLAGFDSMPCSGYDAAQIDLAAWNQSRGIEGGVPSQGFGWEVAFSGAGGLKCRTWRDGLQGIYQEEQVSRPQ